LNQRKDQFWVHINNLMEEGNSGNKTTVEMNLENFFDEL